MPDDVFTAAPGASVAGLSARGLGRSFRPAAAAPVEVLADLDLDLAPGEAVAVVGASGSGKSTLLHVLGGMLRPDSGQLQVNGSRPWEMGTPSRAAWRNSQVGFVFQSHRLLAELTALENVLLPAWIAGEPEAGAAAEAGALLSALGLAGRLHHRPGELSGGEAQRVALARALVRKPAIVLADEPTGNLDREAARRVMDEFLGLQRQRRFMAVVATHSPTVAGACNRVLALAGRRLVEAGAEGA